MDIKFKFLSKTQSNASYKPQKQENLIHGIISQATICGIRVYVLFISRLNISWIIYSLFHRLQLVTAFHSLLHSLTLSFLLTYYTENVQHILLYLDARWSKIFEDVKNANFLLYLCINKFQSRLKYQLCKFGAMLHIQYSQNILNAMNYCHKKYEKKKIILRSWKTFFITKSVNFI